MLAAIYFFFVGGKAQIRTPDFVDRKLILMLDM